MTIETFENIPKEHEQIADERAPLLPRNRDEETQVDKIGRASFHGSVFNLTCTIVGSGIMSLPATMKIVGVVPGVVLIVLAALLTQASIEMLLRFSKPESAYSYEDVLSGSTSSGVHHAGILEGWFGEHWWTSRAVVVLVLTAVVLVPFLCFKRIDSLRFTSAISFALAVVFLAVVIGITIYKFIMGSIEAPKYFPTVTNLSSFWELFTAVPVVIFAYLCHYNVHPIANELADSPSMPTVVKTSVALCAIVYVMTGLFGFFLFGDSTLSDLLSNFDTDLGIPYNSLFNDIVRISYAGHIMLVFPISFFPLRLNVDGLLFPSAAPLSSDNLRFGLVTVGLIAIILLGAIFIPSIWVAFEFTGATVGALLAFIFPACITLKDPHGIATKKDKILSVFMIIVAVFSNVAAIYSDAYSLLTA
ncbi:Transmembrane amino acid transporter family protein, putative [Theobroma cacao]|uniref:Transmembrane amino acid transporter family protein, putative n=1 Tax=Theobroma cacao TaxID=3641 RepID=A0A061EHG4_THECC|nr:Transmembrane amino acid transporter family protein, putative [Theobroma cacao]